MLGGGPCRITSNSQWFIKHSLSSYYYFQQPILVIVEWHGLVTCSRLEQVLRYIRFTIRMGLQMARVLLALMILNCCSTGNAAERPNVVMFIVDDLGIGDVGAFGNESIRTPYIDSICREGVKLEHDLSTAAVCSPSRTALLTGRYPQRSGQSLLLIRTILHLHFKVDYIN